MASSTQWRINITAINGGTFPSVAEVEMRASVGGADECSGGTASAQDAYPGYEAAKAFDNNAATRWMMWGGTGWLQYTFTGAKDIAQVAVTGPEAGQEDKAPKDFTLQYYDGATWQTAQTITNQTGWAAGEVRAFPPTPAPNIAQIAQQVAEVALEGTAAVQVGQVTAEAVWSSDAMCYAQIAQATAEVALEGTAGVQAAQNVLEVVWAGSGDVVPPIPEETDEQTPGVFYYDERDGRVYSVVLPPKPALPSYDKSVLPDTSILPLTGTPAGAGALGAGWTIEGTGFHLAEWAVAPGMGTAPCLHIDTDGTTVNDSVWYDLGAGNEIDLSEATDLSITVFSGGNEEKIGTFLSLCMGEAAYDEIQLPLTVKVANGAKTVTVSVRDIAESSRNAIRYVGLKAIQPAEFVIWAKDIRSGAGITGVSRYKIRDTRVQGWQMPVNTENILPSPEAPGPDDDDLKVDTGTEGVQVTLTRASIPAGLAWWEIYRSDEDETARYHWIANWPNHDRWQPSMTQCASAKPSPRKWQVGDIVRPSTLDKARCASDGTGTSGDYQKFFKVKAIASVPTPKTGAYLKASDEPNWAALTVAGTSEIKDGDITWEWKAATDVQNVLAYVDTEQDIADNPTLEEDRCHVPVPPTGLGIHDNRLVLYVTEPDERTKKPYIGNLWVAGRDNHADWHDWGPESWPELEAFNLLTDASACRLPVSEAGQVMRMLPLGAWTGAAYTGPLCILTAGGQSGQAIALQGTVPSLNPEKDGFSIGHRVPHGCSGPYAAARDSDGRVITATPDGEVVALDRELNHAVLSEQLDLFLKETPPSGRVRWVLGYDPLHRRLVLFVGTRMFCHDGTGWDEMDTGLYGEPTCAATVAGAGGYIVFGGPDMDEIDGGIT